MCRDAVTFTRLITGRSFGKRVTLAGDVYSAAIVVAFSIFPCQFRPKIPSQFRPDLLGAIVDTIEIRNINQKRTEVR